MKSMLYYFAATAIICLAGAAGAAQDKPAIPSGTADLAKTSPTIGEVLTIATAIPQLDYKTALDKDGRQVSLPTDFKFSGLTRLNFVRDLDAARTVQKHYQETVVATRKKLGEEPAAPAKDASAKDVEAYTKAATEYQTKLAAEMQPVFDSPSLVQLVHIKESDLCLDGKTPQQPLCEQKNDIPISVLSALLPILDQK